MFLVDIKDEFKGKKVLTTEGL